MVTLPGLTIGTQLYEGKETAVYRAHDDVAGRSVVIKMLKDEYPSAKAVALLRREFELMGVVVADEILGAYDVRQSGSQHYLVLEDFGGEALNKQWARERMPLAEFFVWAGQLVRGLGVLQGANIMHKDIKPHNIIVNRETMVAKIADFGIASQLEREHVMGEGLGIQQLEGTLAYISPEQTGRMNRPLDYRTDIYSLGVTFYEMLAGELPFQDSEAMGMVHSHLAKKPPALRELAPEVTPMLAAIVAKMMAKVAEERYQSAAGLLADLEMCRIEWEAGMEMWTGELGAHDRSGRLQIAAKLYGREAGREKLLEALGTVTGGQTMLVMIAGYAGIGKSALVQELYKPITAQRGYFIRGKFESMQRQRPYSAFVAAWTDWVKQILTTGETEIELWRERLLEALGGAGQVMVDLVPNLALLLGEQAAVPVLDGMEAQKRFQIVVQNFMRGIVDPERPLLLFLDDWQWADGGSWELLRLIVAEGDLPLLVVGSYRSNEVAEDELFAGSWREVEAAARLLEYIQLEPLGVDDVEALVADSFEQTAAAVRLLAELLHQKAGGNPFFTNELIENLYREGLIWFEDGAGRWAWDLQAIQKRGVMANLVSLMAGKIETLAEETRRLLMIGACVGHEFGLGTVAAVWGGARVEAARLLAEGVEAGLIWGVGENYALLAMMAETEGEGEGIYRFAHEQIQQLFYEEGGAEQHERWHLGIGRYWREDWSEEEQTERVFDLVDQFNRGRAGIDDRDELIELARLNERAARRAQGAAAYDVAAGYYQEALGLWAAVGGGWSANREEILRLYEGASMVAYMGRAYERMEELVRVVMGLTDDLYERMPFHEVQILALIAQNERVKGTELALQVLAELGETFPERPRPWHTVWELLKVRRALKGRSAEALLDLPEMSDRRALAVVTILGRAIAAVFFAVPELYPLMALRRVLLSVRYGNAPLSVSAYGGYGLLLSFLGQYEAGEAFGKMSLKLVDKLGAHELRTRAEMIHYSFIAHWRHHLRDSWERMIAVEQSGTETGDVEYAAYGAVNDAIYGFYLESSLDKMTTEIEREIGLIRQFGQTSSQYVVMALGQVIENLRVEKEEPWVLVGKFYDENEIVPILEADRDLGGLYFYGMQKALLYYMFGQYKEAWQWAIDTEQYVESMRGTATVAFHVFQRALMGAAYWGEVDAGEQKKILKQVKKDYKRIKKWAVVGPMNMGYRERLVAAELARMGGKGEMAIEAYEAAIEQAQANGYYWYGALAYEVAGDFYARAGMDKVANVYWWESRYRYEQWGAMAKVAEMDRVHEALAVRASARVTPSRRAADIAATMNPMTLTTGGRTTTGSNEMFDLSTVVAASEVIFSEIELEALLQKLMRLVIENAGAERGILLLVEDEALVVRAAGDAEEVVVTEVGLTAYGSLPVSLIQYVRRTQERVVLRSANEQGLFTKDTYIRSEGVKSVLAVPLVNQGQLVAILYLENNLSAGVFTAERENIIYLLGVQAAISITNAQAFAVRAEQARLEMEKQLLAEQAAELAKINADKDRFFSIISHDLRSPFNPVMGLAQLMMIDAENFKPADVAEMSTQIYDSSRHVLTLLESLLQWSRIQTGRMPYEPELIDLADLALKTVDLLSGMSGEKRVTLMHMVPAGVMVMADEPMMATVVRNLVSNALKFTPEGGQVLINVYEVGAEEVVFGVADTGVGMPKEVQEKLFRLDTHHTTEGTAGEKGTGLGLVMCQELVEKNGGRIWVESELGEGTVFKVGLPKG